jgi:hypothetical protein
LPISCKQKYITFAYIFTLWYITYLTVLHSSLVLCYGEILDYSNVLTDMATDNRGVMVYLTKELEIELEQYCIDNNITRKNKEGVVLPSLGTGIVQYLKSVILSTAPSTAPSPLPRNRLSTILDRSELLESNIDNSPSTVLTKADVVSIAREEIKQALGAIETEITNIKMALSNAPSPPLLALDSPQKVESVTTNPDPTNWELSPIANLISTGMSCRSIADELNLLGFTNTKGGTATRQSVESYLGRRPDLKAIYENARKKGD